MKLRKLAENMSIRNLRLRDKILISFAVSSMLPLLVLIYIFYNFITPELDHIVKSQGLPNVYVLVLLVTVLSILGVTINLNIVKSIKNLVQKTRSTYSDIGPDQDQEIDEITQLSGNFSSIIEKMHEQMVLLSQFEKDLANTKEQLKVSNRELKKLAVEDELTGLYNRRFFNAKLQEEVKRAKRFNHSLCLMIMDLDDFKSVNDRLGHSVGDKVLREFADLLRKSFREVDIIVRYGGEEFGAILSETDSWAAAAIAERIRRSVEKHSFNKSAEGMHLNLTVSIGISSCDGKNDDTADVIQNADKALQLAKKKGKNKVVEYSESIGRFPVS